MPENLRGVPGSFNLLQTSLMKMFPIVPYSVKMFKMERGPWSYPANLPDLVEEKWRTLGLGVLFGVLQ